MEEDELGQGIIFVGTNNLNRNKDHQSMYNNSYKKRYTTDPALSRDAFYRELCEFSRTLPGKKKRTKRISQLRSKYQGNSCSEKMMERVFLSYFDCFTRTGVIRKNKADLLIFLERNKVDKRIIKRIQEIEHLEPTGEKKVRSQKATTLIEKPLIPTDKNKSIKQSHFSPDKPNETDQKKKKEEFYQLLHVYLIETTSNPKAKMSQELADYCKVYNRSTDYTNRLALAYHDAIKGNLKLSTACVLRNVHLGKRDRVALTKKIDAYKQKHL